MYGWTIEQSREITLEEASYWLQAKNDDGLPEEADEEHYREWMRRHAENN